MLYEVGLPVREEHDALADAEDCRRICRRMAAQSGFKFLDFILNLSWFHDVDQQWDWTFPLGRIFVGQLVVLFNVDHLIQDTSLSSGTSGVGWKWKQPSCSSLRETHCQKYFYINITLSRYWL